MSGQEVEGDPGPGDPGPGGHNTAKGQGTGSADLGQSKLERTTFDLVSREWAEHPLLFSWWDGLNNWLFCLEPMVYLTCQRLVVK